MNEPYYSTRDSKQTSDGIVLTLVYSRAQQNALIVKICRSLTTEQKKLQTQTATE